MSKIELHTAISFLDGILSVDSIPDAPRALNGLQLENGGSVSKVAAAVDGSEKAIHAALETGADLLLLHHGIFWQPMQPITGIAYRKLKAAMDGNLAIYAAHLPLDVHPAYGQFKDGLAVGNGGLDQFGQASVVGGGVNPERDGLFLHLQGFAVP